ncbi:MAG: hypothetical protein ACOY37_02485 [Pseudomonadota bacterium]
MTPVLPADAIRAAIARDDWATAEALIQEHEQALHAAFAGESPAEAGCRESWLQLLAAQRDLIDELRTARDEAGRALDRLGRDRRGVAAYLRGGG